MFTRTITKINIEKKANTDDNGDEFIMIMMLSAGHSEKKKVQHSS